jgi:hypothetical protein
MMYSASLLPCLRLKLAVVLAEDQTRQGEPDVKEAEL